MKFANSTTGKPFRRGGLTSCAFFRSVTAEVVTRGRWSGD